MKKFKIPTASKTTSKTIRFLNDLLDKVEHAIIGKDCSFSSFIVAGIKYALENLEDNDEKNNFFTRDINN